jgi:hypothetical protein
MKKNEVITVEPELWLPDDYVPPKLSNQDLCKLRDRVKETDRKLSRINVDFYEDLFQIRLGEYYIDWGYRSFEQYVNSELTMSLRQIQFYIKVYHKLVYEFNLTKEWLTQIGITKAKVVASCITKENMNKLLEDASLLRTHQLIDIYKGDVDEETQERQSLLTHATNSLKSLSNSELKEFDVKKIKKETESEKSSSKEVKYEKSPLKEVKFEKSTPKEKEEEIYDIPEESLNDEEDFDDEEEIEEDADSEEEESDGDFLYFDVSSLDEEKRFTIEQAISIAMEMYKIDSKEEGLFKVAEVFMNKYHEGDL